MTNDGLITGGILHKTLQSRMVQKYAVLRSIPCLRFATLFHVRLDRIPKALSELAV